MKKNRKHRRPAKTRTRARTARRRAERRARKPGRPAPQRAHVVGGTFDGGPPQLHDDCPICRAMRDVGAIPDENGVVVMTPAQERAFERRRAEIVAEEGVPDGAIFGSGEQLQREYEQTRRQLEAEGFNPNLEELDDEELDRVLQRIGEIGRAREEALRRQAAAGGVN